MARLHVVPDQPVPVADPAQEISENRQSLDVLTATNPLLPIHAKRAVEACADVLRRYEGRGGRE